MGICLRIGTLAIVATAFGCARSGPPAPVVYGDNTRSPAIESRQETSPAPAVRTVEPARAQPVRWAPLPPAPGPGTGPSYPGRPAQDSAAQPKGGHVAKSTRADIRVRRGDTLYAISRRHGLPLRALIAANGLKPPFRLAAGQKLRIPETRYYVVGEGDTVYKLSRQFKVKPAHIIKANRIRTQDHMLYPGQKLLIPSTRQKPVAHTNIKVARAITPDKPDSTTPAIKAHAMAVPSPSLKAPAITKRRNPEAKPKAASKAKAKVQRASIPAPPPPPKRKAAPKKRAALPPRVGGFVWPVKGKLLSSYGKKGNGLYNDGINIEAKNGTPVRAVESGIVAYAGNELKGYGNLLLIRHDGGWISAYAHNGEILVSKGDVVRRGQTVAKVGQSGAVDKPQLHFELRRGPRAVNPLDHLKNTKS